VASGGAGHLNVNLGSLLSWKLLELESEIKNTIRCGKVLASGTKIIILYDTTWGRSPYWLSTNVYISEADYG